MECERVEVLSPGEGMRLGPILRRGELGLDESLLEVLGRPEGFFGRSPFEMEVGAAHYATAPRFAKKHGSAVQD
jgi:hypothetical protein